MKNSMQAYSYLAEWFETLNDDCDYPKWSQYFIDGLARLDAGNKGLELGCGSGAFSRALVKTGYTMSGADISVPMLTKAEKLSREQGLSIPFFAADAVNFTAAEKYDFILSPNDCYNYVPQGKLPQAFRRAAACLKKGGIFWFDLSSEYKLTCKVANNTFVDDREDVTYLSFNTRKGDRVETEVTLFVREGNVYRRCDETHVQYIHRTEDVLAALSERFEVLAVEGHLGEPSEKSDRLNFICRKK